MSSTHFRPSRCKSIRRRLSDDGADRKQSIICTILIRGQVTSEGWLTEHLFEVAYGLHAVVDRSLSDRLEAHCQMEGF